MRARRRSALIVGSLLAGLTSLGVGWAGVGLAPPPSTDRPLVDLPTVEDVLRAAGLDATTTVPGAGTIELAPDEIPAAAASTPPLPASRVPAGTFLVGAARASLLPTPGPWDPTGTRAWQTEGCSTYGVGEAPAPNLDHLLPTSVGDIRGWPAASPDCIYLGGFGLGPVRPAQRVGNGGVWVRSIAISNGEDTFIYSIADAVGWFARYDSTVCTDCGILDVRTRLAGDLGLDVGNVVVGSTHSHATADTYGGWGGIPDWYRAQLRDAAIAAAKQAVTNLRPATIAVGDVQLRNRNNDRRDTYFSNADTGATWLQATALPGAEAAPGTDDVIATWATFAGHPTIVSEPVLHADWPGATARHFEATYGGVGLLFEGGLGNVSVSGVGGVDNESNAENTGIAVADDVARDIARNPRPLVSNDLVASTYQITHPAMTNPGLVTLGMVGLFDREFTPGTKGAGLPGAYSWSKQDGPGQARSCASFGPTVITTAGAHRIGELVVAFAPGEIFSNIAEVVKENVDNTAVTMVLGQSNDALGYIIQSFEFDVQGNAVTEYGTMTGEYEEVFSIDRCFGDHVLQTLLDAAGDVQE
jgi:hypothetical protein